MKVLFISPREVLYSGGGANPDAARFMDAMKKKFTLVALTDEAQDALGTELERCNLLGYFEMIVSSRDYDTRLPDHRIINISLAMLKDRFGEDVSKRECALIGSRPYEDIKCGNDAGIKTVRVMSGANAKAEPEDNSEKPTAKVSDLREAMFLLAPAEEAKPESEKKPEAAVKAKARKVAPKKAKPKKANPGKAKPKAKKSKKKAKKAPKKRKSGNFF